MCVSPIYLKDKKVSVPCSSCYRCKQRKAQQWAFRLKMEFKRSYNARFVTLTYDDQHLPMDNNNIGTLYKPDLQAYFKTLRKNQERRLKSLWKQDQQYEIKDIELAMNSKIKYYAVGEYGGRTQRPHYHIILFNAIWKDQIEHAWQKKKKDYGHVHIGEVTEASIAYVLKYVEKSRIIPFFEGDTREKEFSVMSKKLGDNYITTSRKKYHKENLDRSYVQTEEGIKIAMPRYYKEKIYTKVQRQKVAKIYTKQNQEKQEKLDYETINRNAKIEIENFRKATKRSQDNGKESI